MYHTHTELILKKTSPFFAMLQHTHTHTHTYRTQGLRYSKYLRIQRWSCCLSSSSCSGRLILSHLEPLTHAHSYTRRTSNKGQLSFLSRSSLCMVYFKFSCQRTAEKLLLIIHVKWDNAIIEHFFLYKKKLFVNHRHHLAKKDEMH